MGLLKDVVGKGVPQAAAYGLQGTVAVGLSGAGTSSQSAATPITTSVAVFSTVAANSGALLPRAAKSDEVMVRNGGANALLVYPPVGGTINGGSTNAAFSVTAAKGAIFRCVSDDGLTWIAILGA